jgi:hypothetical protein
VWGITRTRPNAGSLNSGATFTILNKAKGWWVVQKDPDGTGATSQDESLSGWVPAGTWRLPVLESISWG